MQNGFYVARTDWRALHMPHIVLATEVAKAFSDSRLTKFRVQRPYQNSRSVSSWDCTVIMLVFVIWYASPLLWRVCREKAMHQNLLFTRTISQGAIILNATAAHALQGSTNLTKAP